MHRRDITLMRVIFRNLLFAFHYRITIELESQHSWQAYLIWLFRMWCITKWFCVIQYSWFTHELYEFSPKLSRFALDIDMRSTFSLWTYRKERSWMDVNHHRSQMNRISWIEFQLVRFLRFFSTKMNCLFIINRENCGCDRKLSSSSIIPQSNGGDLMVKNAVYIFILLHIYSSWALNLNWWPVSTSHFLAVI